MRRRLVTLLCAAALGACGPPPVDGRKVDTTANAFAYSATLHGATSTETYDWQISGQTAWVVWDGTALVDGTAGLVLTDAAGTEVYRDQAVGPKNPPNAVTATGQAGTWKVRVKYGAAHGKLVLSVTGVR